MKKIVSIFLLVSLLFATPVYGEPKVVPLHKGQTAPFRARREEVSAGASDFDRLINQSRNILSVEKNLPLNIINFWQRQASLYQRQCQVMSMCIICMFAGIPKGMTLSLSYEQKIFSLM